VKFGSDVRHLCQISLLTFETSRSKVKVKVQCQSSGSKSKVKIAALNIVKSQYLGPGLRFTKFGDLTEVILA